MDLVAVHPRAGARFVGRLAVLRAEEAGAALFLQWLPYGASSSSGSPEEGGASAAAYAWSPISLADVFSLRARTPRLGLHCVVVSLRSGVALAPLHFHAGGVRTLLKVLRGHVPLARADDDPSLWLVRPEPDALQRSLHALGLAAEEPPPAEDGALPGTADDAEGLQFATPPPGWAETDLSATTLVVGAVSRAFSGGGLRSLFVADGRDAGEDVAGAQPRPLLPGQAHPRPPLSDDPYEPPPPARPEAHAATHTYTEVGSFELVEGTPPAAAMDGRGGSTPPWQRPRPPPLGAAEWALCFDAEGRVTDTASVRERIFRGGVAPEVRTEVWPFLLSAFDYRATAAERDGERAEKRIEYAALRGQWESIGEAQAKRFSKFRERRTRIDKDVPRTDSSNPFFAREANREKLRSILLTYAFYNFDLSYVQGMSDLLAPILVVMEDEADAFWCFAALMDEMEANFSHDQNGMHAQLSRLECLVAAIDPGLYEHLQAVEATGMLFCFRWVLVIFKREFPFEQVMRLWEAFWSRHCAGAHLHLVACLAVLVRHRDEIFEAGMDNDALFVHTNSLSGTLDLDLLLRDAEALAAHVGPAALGAAVRAL